MNGTPTVPAAIVELVTTGGATRDELAATKPDWLVDDLSELKW